MEGKKKRLDDMLERYGECVTRRDAAKILGVSYSSIINMLRDGRIDLSCAGSMVDVRSLCRYIEEPPKRETFDKRIHVRSEWHIGV